MATPLGRSVAPHEPREHIEPVGPGPFQGGGSQLLYRNSSSLMPRGNFWEATYDPEWDGPTESAPLDHLDGTTGFHQRRVVNPEGQEHHTLHWVASSPQRSFQDCDISVDVIDSLVSNCTFRCCRFLHSTWTDPPPPTVPP